MKRQLAYMRRNVAQGLCRVCPRPLFKAQMCADHYRRHLARRAERIRERARLIEEIRLVDGP